jgi:hypothetical protein
VAARFGQQRDVVAGTLVLVVAAEVHDPRAALERARVLREIVARAQYRGARNARREVAFPIDDE